MNEKQEASQFKNRRRMAWWSFIMLSVCGIGLIVFAMTSDEAAARVASSSWAYTTLFGVWTSIILAYFGANSIAEVWSPK